MRRAFRANNARPTASRKFVNNISVGESGVACAPNAGQIARLPKLSRDHAEVEISWTEAGHGIPHSAKAMAFTSGQGSFANRPYIEVLTLVIDRPPIYSVAASPCHGQRSYHPTRPKDGSRSLIRGIKTLTALVLAAA